MTQADEAFLREFYQNLADKPLEPDDARYVELYGQAAGAGTDPVERLAQHIKWQSESVQLFSGFRGTGKSTELRRLRKLLVERGYLVVLCDMTQFLNLSTPVDISDFLMSIAGAVSEEMAKDPDLLGHDVVKRGYWQRAVEFLGRTQVEIGGLSVGQLKLGLKDDPSFREKLQEQLLGHLGALANDIREFMAECAKAVQDQHGAATRIVVLFDSIEQIRGTTLNEDEVFASVETLFVGHPDKLRFDGMHLIYTVPPWLKIRSPGVSKLYDGSETLPCIKVRSRLGERFETGIETLTQIVAQRGDWTRVFADRSDFEYVVTKTGGYLRDLFRVLQGVLSSASTSDTMPLARPAIDYELAQLRNDYLPISIEDSVWLTEVATSHEAELPKHSAIPALSRFFDTHLLLCYRNGEEWYDLHPLIRDQVLRAANARGAKQPT